MKKILGLLSVLVLGVVLIACKNETGTKGESTIKVYTRDTTSGTREAFFSGIDFAAATGENTPLVTGYVEVDGNGTMMSSLKNDVNGIGYISLSGLAESGLTGLKFENVDPTEANVLSGDYGLKRPFMYMTRETYASADEEALMEAFLAFLGTKEGIAAIQSEGGIVQSSATDPSWDSIKANYPVTAKDNSAITLKFGGSTSVEKVSKALTTAFAPLAGNVKVEHSHTGSGDAWKRTQGTEKDGANAIHMGFLSRDIKSTETHAANTSGRICYDAVVVVVNKENKLVTNLTALQIKGIYDGTFKIWNDVK